MTRAILVLIPSVVAAGAEIQAMAQIRELSRRGIQVRLMVLSDAIDPQVLAGAGLPEDHLCRLRNPSAILDMTFLKRLWRDLGRAAAFIRRHNAETLIAHLPPGHFFARLLFLALILRGRRVRVVQYHHSLEHKLTPRDTLAKRLFHAASQLLARICDHTHWHISEQVRDDVRRGFTRRDAVLQNTCDMDSPGDAGAASRLLAPVRRQGDPYLLLVPGSLRPMKGHVLFLRALARLCSAEEIEPAGLQVIIAGDGDQRAAIESAIAGLNLGDRATVLGAVAHPVLLALYGEADLVVVPSLDEGFGIVAIEAIARRALVLSSDAGGLRDVLRHGQNGFLFTTGNEDALVTELTKIWRARRAPLIDRDAARQDCAARFGLGPHIDRMLTLLPD